EGTGRGRFWRHPNIEPEWPRHRGWAGTSTARELCKEAPSELSAAFAEAAASARLAEALGRGQVHRNQLAHAALGHGDAEQAIDPAHGDRIVGDDHEARIGALAHGIEQVAEALDIGVVERRIDFVE